MTESAPSRLLRNCGIGGRRGLPVVQTPLVSSLIMSASLAGSGVLPIRRVLIGRSDSGSAGSHGTDARTRIRRGFTEIAGNKPCTWEAHLKRS
jgi:hypothetical protein